MKIKVGSDFSGVGAFNQALIRLGIDYEELFACDMDKYARQTFIHNYGEPKYYPSNVYEREIPKESLDIYMTSPPCQSFSMAGKRAGKDDEKGRGILFFNSLEFIQKNKPRFFIFENVKGLLSHDKTNKDATIGSTFQEWINYLGGKSVNGLPTIFPYEDAVPYHIYWKVLNAKEHGVPQNRERVFIIGIRDDKDNSFTFPIEEHLSKNLKDILENEVEEKYFLSEKMLTHLSNHERAQDFIDEKTKNANCITSNYAKQSSDLQYLKVKKDLWIGDYRADEGLRIREDGNSPAIMAMMRDTWKENFTGQNPPLVGYNDKRLNETIDKNELPIGQPKMIDTYNQKIQDNSPTLTEPHHNTTRLWDGYKIRRLTPRECFRLMDFPDTFDFSVVSDSQAYKQAVNSIVVRVLEKIISKLPL